MLLCACASVCVGVSGGLSTGVAKQDDIRYWMRGEERGEFYSLSETDNSRTSDAKE